MNKFDVIKICGAVLKTLNEMDCEKFKPSKESLISLIYPHKKQTDGIKKRISEQELSILFIDEFKRMHKNLFYSIETPTRSKYNFNGSIKDFKVAENDKDCRSASIDLTIFFKEPNEYKRILNVEFKFKSKLESIAKDILKLIGEFEQGVFIHLLKSSDRGTFKNLFNKFQESFETYKEYWKIDDKSILIVFISLKDSDIIYKEIIKSDLNNLDSIFYKNKQSFKISEIIDWDHYHI